MEKDVIDTVEQGPIINLSREWRDNFERVFRQLQQKEAKEQAEKFAKDKLVEQTNDVDRENYLVSVLEDAFFEPRLEVIVRESVDGERECLDFILERINTTHTEERISLTEFFSYFCRRGRLRDNETAVWQFRDLSIMENKFAETANRYSFLEEDDNDPESKKSRLTKDLKEKLCYKQNILREGKGKYNVTVPVLFEFQKNPNESKSTRQKWLEAEMERKEAQL